MTTLSDWPYLTQVQDAADTYGLRTTFRTRRFFGTEGVVLTVQDTEIGGGDSVSFSSWVNTKTKRINTHAHLWIDGDGCGRPIPLWKACRYMKEWAV